MNDRGRLQKGDRVQRMCAKPGQYHKHIKRGTVTHTGPVHVQVQWDDGSRQRYDQSELTYMPEGKEKP
jgi:hypothetical protein